MPKNKKLKQDPQIDFVNLTSHQLRTPLSGTKWLLELLQKSDTGNLNTKQKDFIEKLYVSNERMIALVNDLLEVTRIEQGQIRLYLQPTDLALIIRGLIKNKEKEIKRKNLAISFTIEHEPFPKVRTEMNKIKQALVNILSNAISYTPDGGKIMIELKLEGDLALLVISDNGVGIPKEDQKLVFTRFFRSANATKMETSGTGLGLYISKAFIEASGGRLWFKSEPGKGTSFYFTLPVA